VGYPPAVGWFWCALIVGLMVLIGMRLAAGLRAARDRACPLKGSRLWLGCAVGAATVGLVFVVQFAVLVLMGWLSPGGEIPFGRALMLGHFHLLLAACVLCTTAVTLLLMQLPLRWAARPWALWQGALRPERGADYDALADFCSQRMRAAQLGALALPVIVAIGLQLIAPATAFMAIVPTLGACICALLGCFGRPVRSIGQARLATIGWVAVSGVVCGQVFEWAWGFFQTTGVTTPAVLVPFATMATVVVLPLAQSKRGLSIRQSVSVCAGLMLVGAGAEAAAIALGPGPGHPGLTHALFLASPDEQRFDRLSAVPHLDAWSKEVLGVPGGRPRRDALAPVFERPLWVSAAMPVAVTTPDVSIAYVSGAGGLHLRAKPANHARLVRVLVRSDGDLKDVSLNGRLVLHGIPRGQWCELDYVAPPQQLDLTFSAPMHGAMEAYIGEVSEGWPQGSAIPAKPAWLMSWYDSDTTVVLRKMRPAW